MSTGVTTVAGRPQPGSATCMVVAQPMARHKYDFSVQWTGLTNLMLQPVILSGLRTEEWPGSGSNAHLPRWVRQRTRSLTSSKQFSLLVNFRLQRRKRKFTRWKCQLLQPEVSASTILGKMNCNRWKKANAFFFYAKQLGFSPSISRIPSLLLWQCWCRCYDWHPLGGRWQSFFFFFFFFPYRTLLGN